MLHRGGRLFRLQSRFMTWEFMVGNSTRWTLHQDIYCMFPKSTGFSKKPFVTSLNIVSFLSVLNFWAVSSKPRGLLLCSPLHTDESECLSLHYPFTVGSFSKPWEFCLLHSPKPLVITCFHPYFLNRRQELTLDPEMKTSADWRW